jgi:hypothetical protein
MTQRGAWLMVVLLSLGCGGGGSDICTAGATLCEDDHVVQCKADGSGFEFAKSCASGTTCEAGECVGIPDFRFGDTQTTADVPVDTTQQDSTQQDTSPPDTTTGPQCGNGVVDPGEACDPATSVGCPTVCLNPPGCTYQSLVGSAALCTARCETGIINDLIDGDGCCPVSGTPDNDTDCTLCGNGHLDLGETCDPPASCMTSCPAGQSPCIQVTQAGAPETCNIECISSPVTTFVDGDGCCPIGGTASTDIDCQLCGNGKLDSGETCDPPSTCPTSCPADDGCKHYTYLGNVNICNAECVGTPITAMINGDNCCPNGASAQTDSDCAASTCGDGQVTGGEECDGPDLTPMDCTAFGYFGGGKLSCLFDCTVSTLGCQGSHLLLYSPVVNILAKGNLTRVRWHPSGTYALIVGSGGQILRYTATNQALDLVLEVDGNAEDIEVDPAGGFFVIAGTNDNDMGTLWRVNDDGTGTLSDGGATTVNTGKPVALTVAPDGSQWVVGVRGNNSISYLLRWSPTAGITKTKGFNASAGLTDITWANPTIYGGADTILTSHGVNGADSQSYLLTTDTIIDNGWKGSFGNAGGAGWRPGGTYGLITGWSSNKVYVFDGGWTMTALPVPTGAAPQSVRWKSDGSRALIVGKTIGSPAYAVVIDHRPGGTVGYDPNAFVDVSIPGFTSPPWSKKTGMHLFDADWQPNTSCEGGLIVGGHSGSSFSPTFGTVIRFVDQDDPNCGF